MKHSVWWRAALLLIFCVGIGSAFSEEEAKLPLSEPPGITGGDQESVGPPKESFPPPPAAAALPQEQSQLSTEEQARERLQATVALSFTNADLRNVLNGLAKTYGLNIVVNDTVKGTVNIALRGVTLGEALKQILRLNGYTFVWEGSIIRVVSLEEEEVTEILFLNFIQADVAMEFLKRESSETGVMKADEIQGGLLVTDKASQVEAMKEILKKIDMPPQQVVIQARLLDVTHTDQDNLGLKLSSASFDIPLRASSGPFRILNIASGALDLSGPSSELTTDTVTATISKGPETFTATLDALIRNKRVKVLASPTVTTLNNVEAKITIGEKFPIKETTQTTTGTLETTRFVDIGITLRVTPKINRAGFIQMQIHPEVSSVSSTIDAGPRITTREADTTIIVKDQESVIIAGLIKEEETITRDRIPLLGHIPGLGWIFNNRAKSYEQKELVIVITPTLLPIQSPQKVPTEIQEVDTRISGTELFRQAYDFEFGKSLQARDLPEGVRILHAVELYESMADRFPGHTLTPEALWRAGALGWDRLRDSARAEDTFTRLSAEYPAHPLAPQARKRAQEIQNYLARQQRKTAKGSFQPSSKEKREPTANYGFR